MLLKKLTNSLKEAQPKKFESFDMGKISMMLTGDIRKISAAGQTYHNIFLLPVLLIVYLTLIIIELKWVGVLCPVLIILSLLIQTKFNKKVFALDKFRRKEADVRNKLISEFISGAKYMKMNAWEPITLEKT
jgi:ABC-type siderophore export system fused ATPase/permease subunit